MFHIQIHQNTTNYSYFIDVWGSIRELMKVNVSYSNSSYFIDVWGSIRELMKVSDRDRNVNEVRELVVFWWILICRCVDVCCIYVGRAWLYQALSDHLLESYIRCYVDNEKLVKSFYMPDALVLDYQVLTVYSLRHSLNHSLTYTVSTCLMHWYSTTRYSQFTHSVTH